MRICRSSSSLDQVGSDHTETSEEGSWENDSSPGGGHGLRLSGRSGRRLRNVGRLASGFGTSWLRAGRRRLRNGTIGRWDRRRRWDGGHWGRRDNSGVLMRVLRLLNEDR